MNISQTIDGLYQMLVQFIPLFRYIWAGTIVVGLVLLGSAYFVRKGSERKRLSMVLCIIGALFVLSSSAQLIISFI